jgi:hypothetical protein
VLSLRGVYPFVIWLYKKLFAIFMNVLFLSSFFLSMTSSTYSL